MRGTQWQQNAQVARGVRRLLEPIGRVKMATDGLHCRRPTLRVLPYNSRRESFGRDRHGEIRCGGDGRLRATKLKSDRLLANT
jgi:hypothetical protein